MLGVSQPTINGDYQNLINPKPIQAKGLTTVNDHMKSPGTEATGKGRRLEPLQAQLFNFKWLARSDACAVFRSSGTPRAPDCS
jgi:hypothetical protein